MNTKEAREKARNSLLVSMKGKFKGKDNPNYGKRWTDEMRQRASEKRKGKPGFADKKKLSEAGKKKWQNPEYRASILKIIEKSNKARSKKIICTETGNIFESISEAARFLGIKSNRLSEQLNGRRPNRTSFRYHLPS